MWRSFDDGRTIRKSGSEAGIIVRDEEHVEGARITLERDGHAPFAITCGIYGWMVHTRFFANEKEARRAYDDIKHALDRIIRSIPLKNDPDRDARTEAVTRMIEEFVAHHR